MNVIKSIVNEKLIVSLSTDSRIYELGRKVFLDDGIKHVREEKVPTGGLVKFEIADEKEYLAVVKIDFTGVVKGYSCTCENSLDYFGACEHVIAALFYLADINNFKGTRIKTDYITTELTENFKTKFLSENIFLNHAESRKFIAIEPTINFTASEKIYLSFRIGTKIDDIILKNSYVIKNIGEFLKIMDCHGYFSYGKDLAFVHNINKFDEKSKKIIHMLYVEKSNIDDATNIISKNNSLVKVNNFTNSKDLFVSNEGFDKLFDAFNNDKIIPYECLTQTPNLKFKGLVLDNKLILYKPVEEFFVHMGNSFGYVIMGKFIFRVDLKCGFCLKFLSEAFGKTKNESIEFKKDSINDFFSFILPILTKYDLIQNNYLQEFYEIGYLPLDAKLYLDMDKNNIIGKLEFFYGESQIIYGEDSYYNGFRDTLKEEEILETLSFYGFNVNENNNFILKIDDDIFQFYKSGIYTLNLVCEVFVTNSFKQKQYFKEFVDTRLSVKISEDLLKMEVINSQYSMDQLLEALESFKIGKKYFRLKSGKFVDLEDENIKKTMNIINVLKNDINGNEIVVNKNKSVFINDLLESTNFSAEKDNAFQVLVDKIKNVKNIKIVFSEFLGKILRHYQKDGINWLKGLVDLGFGAILADEMGLGKTIEVIGLIEINEDLSKPHIIICPTSLIYNWKNEFKRFAPNQKVELIVGTPFEREELIKNIEGSKIYITTYDMMKRDIEAYENVFFKYVILDEAQNIKNPTTLSAKAVKKLNRENGIALTGTPIENSLKELWSIFDFIIPGYLNTLTEFYSTYGIPIMNENDSDVTLLLRNQISPFILRRFKKDVLLELPDKIETIMYADMTVEQDIAYMAFFKAAKGEILEFEEISQINIIRKLTRLRQLSCHPQLFLEGYKGGSGKLNITLETLRNAISEGHRVLLFSQFTSMLSIIMKELDENNFNYFYLDGKTKSKDRELMCARFNSGEKDIFLISLKAGGTGLNLTGADVVIHYDPWWNPSVMNQASDRAHRFGQKKVVQIFNIITKDTIEEKIYNLQQKKKELIDNVLTDEVKFINNLSKDELVNLFFD